MRTALACALRLCLCAAPLLVRCGQQGNRATRQQAKVHSCFSQLLLIANAKVANAKVENVLKKE
jgi:hypothetical protein